MSASRSGKMTKGQLAYARLKERIQAGAFPRDEPITEASVSGLLTVGRGPAREALLRLEAEGLVRSRGPHKTRYVQFVEDLDPDRLRAQLDIREVIDGLAARGAALHLTGAQVRRLRALHAAIADAIRAGDRLARGGATRELFELIRSGCGNPLVGTVLETCEILPIFAREDETDASLWADKDSSDLRVATLAAVVEAIAAHDPDAAEAAMRAALRESARVLLGWLASHGPAGGKGKRSLG